MTVNYIAHVRKADNLEQSVATHLTETAAIARELAAKLDLSAAGELLGLMHDFGKYSKKFQKRIYENNGLEFYDYDEDAGTDDDGGLGNKPDHSTAGAQWVYGRLKKFGAQNGIGELVGQILGLCIASHHGAGLIDCLNSEGEAVWRTRFSKDDALTHLAECEQNADEAVKRQANSLANEDLVKLLLKPLAAILNQPDSNEKIKEFHLGCEPTPNS